MRDPRTGRYLASVTSWFYGPRIWITDDPAGEWEQAEGTTLPEGDEQALERIWVIVPGAEDGVLYAGGDPGPLFESRDGGSTWSLNRGLWDHPTRSDWSPGNGGLCLHTIAPWPGDPSKLLVAISSVGVWLTEDGGETWNHSNTGIVPEYLPEEARDNPIAHCVHDVRRSPGRPERLFMQFHGGVYRSDDAGGSWIDVGEGLPSDFGFPVVVDPADPDSAYVIPLIGAEDRTTPGGTVNVWETRDAGGTWTPAATASPRRTRTSPCSARRSTRRARAARSSCTSARRRARSTARATPAEAGPPSRRTCRPSTRSGGLALSRRRSPPSRSAPA